MNSIQLPERCETADSSKSDDPLDGKPSEDAKLTHVDSCSSLPEAGDDLISSCSRRNSNPQPQPNYQAVGRNDELGNETTLMQLLANASTLDPRSLLPTPFAPGQSAQTLLEQEQLRKKREQENEEWHAVCDLSASASVQRPASVAAAQAHAQMLLQNSPLVLQQPLQFGRGQHQPFIQQQLQAQPLLQQQHLLDLQQQGLLNTQQVNPLHLQSLYATNPSQLAYQQSTLNEMPISSLLGVGLNSLGATGTSQNSVMNNLTMPGLIPPSMPMTHNLASTLTLGTDTLDSAGGLNWLLQRQPYEQGTMTTKKKRSHMKVKGPKEEPAKAARKRSGKGNSKDARRSSRWAERYKELLEFKRVEGHCRVPHGYPQNKKLSWWIMNQRAQYARRLQGKTSWLTEERIKLLDDIGFTWSPNSRGCR